MKSAKYLVLLGIISIVASACSSAAAEATATVQPTATTVAGSSQEARFYLKSIENNAIQVTAAFARFDEQMSKVWPVRSSLFDALRDSNVSQEIISSMGAIIQLSPPDEFEQEHLILQSTASAAAEYARELGQALERRDLNETSVAFANFRVSYQRMLITVSPQLCNALGIRDEPETLCEVRAGATGTRDAGVEQLFKEFRVEFIPRVTVFPAAMTDEERFDTLAALNRDVETATRAAADKLAALSPPPERAGDHQILLTYLEDTGKTASAITIAGTERDDDKVLKLFEQSGVVVRAAGSTISCEYSETLLHGFFSDDAC